MKLALKVDVDTYDGMRDGVPKLLKLFKSLGLKASFFIPFGPDQSGRAVFRIFTKKGFLKKMFRTNALKLYGIKTALRGTLLPAPMIGASFPNLVKDILSEGHELGIHGYNHVEWQDRLLKMTKRKVERQFKKGIAAYEAVVGEIPRAFAAPAWLCSPMSLKILDEFAFSYASDTRGRIPFYPVMASVRFRTLQVPSTLPTLDELLAWEGVQTDNVNEILTREIIRSGLPAHVHSIHTEVEGTALFPVFAQWLENLRKQNAAFVTVQEIAREAQGSLNTPVCEIVLGELPGRAGKVACQKIN